MFVALPTVLLILTSFSQRDFLGRVVYDFTFENYIRCFDTTWLTIFGNSILYAFLATVICVVVGYPAAYTIGRASPDRKSTRLNSSHVSESRMPSSA